MMKKVLNGYTLLKHLMRFFELLNDFNDF